MSFPDVPSAYPRRMRRVDLGELQSTFHAGSLRFALAKVDRGGRIVSHDVFGQLGWSPGDSLECELGRTYAVVRRAAEGPMVIDSRKRLQLQHVLLRRCGVNAGDPVLLIGAREQGLLIIHSMADLAHMARIFHAEQYQGVGLEVFRHER